MATFCCQYVEHLSTLDQCAMYKQELFSHLSSLLSSRKILNDFVRKRRNFSSLYLTGSDHIFAYLSHFIKFKCLCYLDY